jgi:hypothetical protein
VRIVAGQFDRLHAVDDEHVVPIVPAMSLDLALVSIPLAGRQYLLGQIALEAAVTDDKCVGSRLPPIQTTALDVAA